MGGKEEGKNKGTEGKRAGWECWGEEAEEGRRRGTLEDQEGREGGGREGGERSGGSGEEGEEP